MLCLIISALFLLMIASRIQAGTGFDCSAEYLHFEKNAIAVT
jgi:hypothetical protein